MNKVRTKSAKASFPDPVARRDGSGNWTVTATVEYSGGGTVVKTERVVKTAGTWREALAQWLEYVKNF